MIISKRKIKAVIQCAGYLLYSMGSVINAETEDEEADARIVLLHTIVALGDAMGDAFGLDLVNGVISDEFVSEVTGVHGQTCPEE